MIFEREYSTGVYLLSPGTEVIGAQIVSLWASGAVDVVAALSLINMALVGIGLAAAFRDPRFPPLQREELDTVRIEVSLLSPPEVVPFTTESEALAALVPGQDGVILEDGRRRATFLPQVWETLPRPVDFLARLKEKAGLAADAWPPAIRLYRYRVRKWAEA